MRTINTTDCSWLRLRRRHVTKASKVAADLHPVVSTWGCGQFLAVVLEKCSTCSSAARYILKYTVYHVCCTIMCHLVGGHSQQQQLFQDS